MPAVGSMRDRVLIQRKSVTVDGQGGRHVTWQDYDESFCRIRTVSLSARNRYQQFQVDVTHMIEMREVDGLDENMRMLLITDTEAEPRYFDIVSVEDHKRRKRFSIVLVRDVNMKQGNSRNR